MSEFISKKEGEKEARKERIKEIIQILHKEGSFEEARSLFEKAFEGVSAEEITQAEQALIDEGLAVSEVQKLCDVHASVFKGSIEEIHAPTDPSQIKGHPAHTIIEENKILTAIMDDQVRPALKVLMDSGQPQDKADLIEAFKALLVIDVHYQKKENTFFSYMEKHGITAPPQVMWGVDDEVRKKIKQLIDYLGEDRALDLERIKRQTEEALTQAQEMIFKEEEIMLPMLVDNMTEEEWMTAYRDAREYGYLMAEPPYWDKAEAAEKSQSSPAKKVNPTPALGQASQEEIQLPTGRFNAKELAAVFATLPVDVTFVDAEDRVKFFSQTPKRPFPRSKAILGRHVSNCHPPSSVNVVEDIVEDFKAGRKDQEDFWLHFKDMYVLIRYYALRDEEGNYLGVLEATQDIKPIQEIEGENRLVDF